MNTFLKGSQSLGKYASTASLSKKPHGSVFFLHGSCDTGHGLQTWLRNILNQEFCFQNFNVIYPSADTRPYSLHKGKNASVWFDRLALSPQSPEDILTINESCQNMRYEIETECKNHGIPYNKVIIGGFSMGGAMAFHLGYRMHPQIAGVFALSSFLPEDSKVYEALEYRRKDISEGKKPLPKLFMTHGMKDPLVNFAWGKKTFNKLKDLDVDGHFHTFPSGNHSISKTQLGMLHKWINDLLNDKPPKNEMRTHREHHINDEMAIPID